MTRTVETKEEKVQVRAMGEKRARRCQKASHKLYKSGRRIPVRLMFLTCEQCLLKVWENYCHIRMGHRKESRPNPVQSCKKTRKGGRWHLCITKRWATTQKRHFVFQMDKDIMLQTRREFYTSQLEKLRDPVMELRKGWEIKRNKD